MIRIHTGASVAGLALATASIAIVGVSDSSAASPHAVPTYQVSSTRHLEPAICGPITALIEYWLPVTDRATPHPRIIKRYPSGAVTYAQPGYPWSGAASTLYGIARYAPEGLRISTETTADAIHALGAQPDPSAWRPVLRTALRDVRSACPSLPESVVTGPLPR